MELVTYSAWPLATCAAVDEATLLLIGLVPEISCCAIAMPIAPSIAAKQPLQCGKERLFIAEKSAA